MAYYNSYALHRKLDDCDLDSVEAYEKFAKDHYGELGFSRMNVGGRPSITLVGNGLSRLASVIRPMWMWG